MRVVLVYHQWFQHSSLLKCILQAKIGKKILNPLISRVHGRSKSSILVAPKSSSAVLVMIRSKSVSICNRSHTRSANSGEITGVPLFDNLVRGEPLSQWHEICSQETRDSRLSYGENPESLSHLGLNHDRQTDRRTDRITTANMRLAVLRWCFLIIYVHVSKQVSTGK